MRSEVIVACAFFHAPGRAPNGRAVSVRSKFIMYYRCMSVMFHSARKAIPDAKLVVYTNRPPDDVFFEIMRGLEVEVVTVSSSKYANLKCIENSFPGCMFLLDAIVFYSEGHLNKSDAVVIFVDPDCIFLRSPVDAIRGAAGGMFVGLGIEYPPQRIVNGHSAMSLSMIAHQVFGGEISFPGVKYFGGEFFAFNNKMASEVARKIGECWRWLEFVGGRHLGFQLTEEHILSVVASSVGARYIDARSEVKRVWTSPAYSNWSAGDCSLAIWHLPAEKNYGFRRLFLSLGDWFSLAQDQYLRFLSKEFKRQSVFRFLMSLFSRTVRWG